jgi:chaperonin GroES
LAQELLYRVKKLANRQFWQGGFVTSLPGAKQTYINRLSGGYGTMATTAKKKPSKKKTNLQPLGERIVVSREVTQDQTAGGIFLPESAKDKSSRGTVIAVGEGRLLKDGSRSPLQVKPGDMVIFTSYGPDEFKDGDQEFLLMREDDVLAIIG